MIDPPHRCSPSCSGYVIARPLGIPIAVRCPHCWEGATLTPDSRYYSRQPEPAAAVRFESALAKPSRCIRCSAPAVFDEYYCELCEDRNQDAGNDARDDAAE